jgi:hypothetical protein
MIQELQYVSRYFLLEPSNDMPIIIKQKKEFVSYYDNTDSSYRVLKKNSIRIKPI